MGGCIWYSVEGTGQTLLTHTVPAVTSHSLGTSVLIILLIMVPRNKDNLAFSTTATWHIFADILAVIASLLHYINDRHLYYAVSREANSVVCLFYNSSGNVLVKTVCQMPMLL